MMTVHVERGSDVTFHYALAGKEETAKIHKSDYDHLRSLFDKANPSEKDDDSFHKCLLKLLLRCCSSCSLMRSYNTVSGNVRGYQMASVRGGVYDSEYKAHFGAIGEGGGGEEGIDILHHRAEVGREGL